MKDFILRFFLILFLLTITAEQNFSRDITFTNKADSLFSDDDYRVLIKKVARDYALTKGLSETFFEQQYLFIESKLIEYSKPNIEMRFIHLESGFSSDVKPGSPAFLKRKSKYANEIYKAVRETIENNNEIKIRFNTENKIDAILSFDSDVKIEKDGKIIVIETITIFNGDGIGNDDETNQIKRGIVRDFPTKYIRSDGLISNVPFKIIEVLRDNTKEPYTTEDLENGVRIYIGSANYFLENGIFTYKITYETGKQIIFHNDKDEFYWNVTGNGWAFSIGKISCKLIFPENSKIIEYDCYTGYQGSTDKDCKFSLISDNSITFYSTKAMEKYQGLTVAASINKGILIPPSTFEKILSLILDNIILPVLFLIFLLYFSINFYAWRKWGKDPSKGTIIPQFEPPDGLSPADVGFLLKQKFTPNLFAASLIDYAVHKLVDIEVKKEGAIIKSTAYYFNKPNNEIDDEAERTLYNYYNYNIDKFYGEKAKKGDYNPTIKAAYDSLKAHLLRRLTVKRREKNIYKKYLNLNNNFTGLGIIFLMIIGIGTLAYLAMNQSVTLSIVSVSILLATLIVQIIFIKIMPSYTPKGRQAVDHILGFKMYLEAAETKIFDTMNPPEKTLELFEKYLPYAIALECENRWAEKFKNIIDKAIENGYEPSYYRGITSTSFNYSTFSSGISSGLTSTISSASTPPSSSGGGSSGGGSSGGGGGGGGGGGW